MTLTCMKTGLVLLLTCLVGGCSTLQSGKLLAPESFGLVPAHPSLYVEAGTDEATRSGRLHAMERAERALHSAYGEVKSTPTVYACISEACYREFGGGRASIAKAYGQRILLSPRALNWHFIAHEWSHAEMSTRLTLAAWMRLPRWFDEGIAVAVSEAPEHSETHWQFLVATNVPRPTTQELKQIKSLNQWLDAVRRYGDDKNLDRAANGEAELRPLYSAAGHELRHWLANAGRTGLIDLIERLNNGEEFETAYELSAFPTQKMPQLPPTRADPTHHTP